MRSGTNAANGRWTRLGLATLNTLFGLQVLRAFLPLLLYVLRDRFGWSAPQLGLLAFALFLATFLASRLRSVLRRQRYLALTAGGLALLRLVIQLWPGDPLVDFVLAGLASLLFFLSFPAFLGHIRSGGVEMTGTFGLGILLGAAVDVALHGLYNTYDMVWRVDVITAVFVPILVIIHWLLLARCLTQTMTDRSTANDTSFRLAASLIGLGPFIFLHLLILGNVARLTTLTGWSLPWAFGWTVLAALLGWGTAVFLLHHLSTRTRYAALALGGLLITALLFPWPTGPFAAIQLLAAAPAAAGLLILIFAGLGAGYGRTGLPRITIANGIGALLLVLFLFTYYSSYDISLPFSNGLLPPLAGLVMAVGAFLATRAFGEEKTMFSRPWRMALPAVLLLLFPLAKQFAWQPVAPAAPTGVPVRVMTYNLHNGFDIQGNLNLEAQAQVIAAAGADVIGLQEASRGWVMNGSVDMVTWLSQRLEMPYVYRGTADPIWGNAILSRYPILEWESLPLPTDDLLLRRGFIWTRIDVGGPQPLHVITTHFHHPPDDSFIREMEAQAILDFWQGQPHTVIMGDLNASPGDPEIERFRDAGLTDALALTDITPGFTHPVPDATARIDYIWLTPDLSAGDVTIPLTTASDHLPVTAAIGLER